MNDNYYHPHNVAIGNNYTPLSDMQKVNAQFISEYLQSKGWTIAAAAGLMGNFLSESWLNPDVFEDRSNYNIRDLIKKGYGLAQWTPWYGLSGSTEQQRRNYHGTNNPTFYQWCIDNNKSETYWMIETQLDYIDAGLGASGSKTFIPQLKTASDPQQAAKDFYTNYEKSQAGTWGNRPVYAQWIYDYLGGLPPTPAGIPVWLLFKFKRR